MSRLNPELSIIAPPLRELTSNTNTWVWLQHHSDSFGLIKQKICKYTLLQFFDPHQPTYLEVDSSLIGIRCALLQNPEEKGNKQGQYLDINPMYTGFQIQTV